MGKITDKDLKRYVKEIKSFLPIYTKGEKKFLEDFKGSLYDYMEENPEASDPEMRDHFGMPQEVVYNYTQSMDYEKLRKDIVMVKKAKAITFCILLILLILVGSGLMKCVDYSFGNAYQSLRDGFYECNTKLIEPDITPDEKKEALKELGKVCHSRAEYVEHAAQYSGLYRRFDTGELEFFLWSLENITEDTSDEEIEKYEDMVKQIDQEFVHSHGTDFTYFDYAFITDRFRVSETAANIREICENAEL